MLPMCIPRLNKITFPTDIGLFQWLNQSSRAHAVMHFELVRTMMSWKVLRIALCRLQLAFSIPNARRFEVRNCQVGQLLENLIQSDLGQWPHPTRASTPHRPWQSDHLRDEMTYWAMRPNIAETFNRKFFFDVQQPA